MFHSRNEIPLQFVLLHIVRTNPFDYSNTLKEPLASGKEKSPLCKKIQGRCWRIELKVKLCSCSFCPLVNLQEEWCLRVDDTTQTSVSVFTFGNTIIPDAYDSRMS